MRKRIAYIGISYPLLYDYQHLAPKTINDKSDSPNPIIESPLGLMILYDELVFLCRSICPNNMRNLPYVKFVDEMFPDFYFKGILNLVNKSQDTIKIIPEIDFNDIVSSMNLEKWILDIHTHSLQIGDVELSARSDEYMFLFDMYIFQALQELYYLDIELIANSKFRMGALSSNANAELVEKIIIPDIPNYIRADGPYHECMEELRYNKYIKDFRNWIIEQHIHLQHTEINEISNAVNRNIEEVQKTTFRKYLDSHNGFSFFKSTSSTIVKTGLGMFNPWISITDAFYGISGNGKETLNAKSVRWQGFVLDSRDTLRRLE